MISGWGGILKSLAIGLKDIRIIFRDKKALALVIAMPLILIGILGASLGPVFSGNGEIGVINTALVDKDKGSIAGEIRNMLTGDELKDLFKIKDLSEFKAVADLKNGDLAAILIIPEGFSEAVRAGSPARLEVIADPGSPLKAGIFKDIIESFAITSSGISIGVSTTVTILAESGKGSKEILDLVPGISNDYINRIKEPLMRIDHKAIKGNKQVSSFQYYSAGMAVMFVLFSGMLGLKSILEEKNDHTLMRLMSAPVTNLTIIRGKFLGILFSGFLQVAVIVIVTSILYGVYWGRSYVGIALMAGATVIAASGMAIFVAAAAKSARKAEAIAAIGIQLMSLLGGSMVPLNVFPSFMQKLSYFTINKWAIQGFSDLMMDKTMVAVIQPSMVLVLLGIVFLALGAWRLELQ